MDLTQAQVRAFVGSKADYYLERWYGINEFGGWRALGFNWGAFFGIYTWLVYRRMYRTFSIAIGIWLALQMGLIISASLALTSKSTVLAVMSIIALVASPIALPVMFGIYGTHWYYLHACREVSSLTPDGQRDLQVVAGRGGSDLPGAITSVAVYAFLYMATKGFRS